MKNEKPIHALNKSKPTRNKLFDKQQKRMNQVNILLNSSSRPFLKISVKHEKVAKVKNILSEQIDFYFGRK